MTARQLCPVSKSALQDWLGALARGPREGGQKFCLVVDADRTLAPDDTGRRITGAFGVADQIRAGFELHGYSSLGFATMSSIVSTIPVRRYLAESERVAERVALYPTWCAIFGALASRVPIVVATAGIPQVWRSILNRHGYPQLTVVGGCHRSLDPALVTSDSKRLLVSLLQQSGWKVIAAGDSRIDLPMLAAADVALFVPDPKGSPALRASLGEVPGIKHLIVDDQRFEELCAVSALDLVQWLLPAGEEHAHSTHR